MAEKFDSYLITGGSGFCGFEIVKYLLTKGHKVRILDLESPPGFKKGDRSKTDLSPFLASIEFFQANICDKDAIAPAFNGISKVIHCAAKVPISKAGKDFWRVNVEGTQNILAAAREAGVMKVVHLSSSSVQISEQNPVDEDAPYQPVGPYAKSKMEGEFVCRDFLQKGMTIQIIRPRTVIGKGRLGIFDIFFEWISEGRAVYLIGKGENKIQFLHSEDLASACYLASLEEKSNIFNIGSLSFGTLREDLQSLLDAAKTGSTLRFLPVSASIIALAILDGLRLSPLASWHYLTFHKDFYFNNLRAKTILGWTPKYGNREILQRAYDDYLLSKSQPSPYGASHRKKLKQGILRLLKYFS